MFVKTTTVLALIGTFAQFTIATPPACVIGAISTASNPRDISSICNSADGVKSYISSNCGSNQQAAIGYFAGVCSGAGVTVSTDLPSSSSASSTKSVLPSTTSRSSGASSASATFETDSDLSSSTSTTSGSGSSSTPTGSMTTSVVIASATASIPVASASAPAPAPASPSTSQGAAPRMVIDTLGLAAAGALGAAALIL